MKEFIKKYWSLILAFFASIITALVVNNANKKKQEQEKSK